VLCPVRRPVTTLKNAAYTSKRPCSKITSRLNMKSALYVGDDIVKKSKAKNYYIFHSMHYDLVTTE
jgi:hypothetical protein